jgi:CRP-like cAMP-binding protein
MRNLSATGEVPAGTLDALARFRGLGQLPAERLQEVAGSGAVLQYEPGETIVHQGDPADGFFLLLQGQVAIHLGEGAEREEVGRVAPPFSIGEVGCLLEKPRTATVVAVDRVQALRLTALALGQMFAEIPGFGLSVARFLADRLDHVAGSLGPPGRGDHSPGLAGLAAR